MKIEIDGVIWIKWRFRGTWRNANWKQNKIEKYKRETINWKDEKWFLT